VEEFLVVWENEPAGQPDYISGRRVFADGSGFPPGDGFTISSGTVSRYYPDVAYNLARNEYLVTWDIEADSSGKDIYGVRLTGSGIPIGGATAEFVIAGWPDNEEHPSVAACDQVDQYLVTWQSNVGAPYYENVYGRFISGDGVPAGVYLFSGNAGNEQEADVTCNQTGKQYLSAWKNWYATGDYGIWSRLANPDETLETSFSSVDPVDSGDRTHPAVAGGRSNYLVVWEHERGGTSTCKDIRGRYVTPHVLFFPAVSR
jgi:hypothetical protein